MKYCLDTNVCIRVLKGLPAPAISKVQKIENHEIIVPSIVRYELYYGACKSVRKDKTLEILNDFLSRFDNASFDDECAKICGEIRSNLDMHGTPIGPYDLMIAAIALSKKLILVTHNTKEFSKIDNLLIEDWEA